MRKIEEILDNWPTRTAGIVFILILSLVLFNVFSDLPEQYPLFGVLNFAMVPVLFIIGGIVFAWAILKMGGTK